MHSQYHIDTEFSQVMLEVEDIVTKKIYVAVLDENNQPVACFHRDDPSDVKEYEYARQVIEGAL